MDRNSFLMNAARLMGLLRSYGYWAVSAAVVGMVSCSAQTSTPVQPSSPGGLVASEQSSAATANVRRLGQILAQRDRDGFGAGSAFALGPGDVLEISAPLEEFEHREVRVSPEDTIALPMIGEVDVRGMTERGLTDELRRRLSKYMHDPPVVLFVKSYGSREVAVTGAVEKPGLYTLKSGSDSLMEMIGRAGGITSEASPTLIFAPAEADANPAGAAFLTAASSNRAGQDTPVANEGGVRAEISKTDAIRPDPPDSTDTEGADAIQAGLHPITIGMNDPQMRKYLYMPARPGDMLIVPSAGEVTVGGWVQNPAAYKITPGMTVLSAINAAGGPLFSTNATVLRTDSSGQRIGIPVNISEVQEGKQRDVPMQSGDVVMMDRSVAGAVPYAFYEIFSKFGTGMYLPPP